MDNTTLHNTKHVKLGMKMFGSIVILAAVFFGGVFIGYANRPAAEKITAVVNKEPLLATASPTADFNTFWKVWSTLDQKFTDADKVTAQERLYGAIKGMVDSFGDPYTTFFPPSENTAFQTEISGSFDGIGVEIGQKDNVLVVIAPLKNTPAERVGILAGDKIIEIGDKSTNGMTIDEAITLIRGKAGTSVKLTIVREGLAQPKVFMVARDRIDLPTVQTETRPDKKVFIIHLYNFSAKSPQLFRQALQEYVTSGYPNLLLDLRGNPGGYLDASVTMAGWFIPEGKTIVKEIGKDASDTTVLTSKGPVLFPKTSKLIILVDKGSASASEILAGALSEHGIGTLVGEQTYGKGSVQELIKLSNDTSLKVTVAKWYTPNGVSISKSGLTPSVKIPASEKKNGTDTQLETAVGLFK